MLGFEQHGSHDHSPSDKQPSNSDLKPNNSELKPNTGSMGKPTTMHNTNLTPHPTVKPTVKFLKRSLHYEPYKMTNEMLYTLSDALRTIVVILNSNLSSDIKLDLIKNRIRAMTNPSLRGDKDDSAEFLKKVLDAAMQISEPQLKRTKLSNYDYDFESKYNHLKTNADILHPEKE